MGVIKRPNDVWLRLWLIIILFGLSFLNIYFLAPIIVAKGVPQYLELVMAILLTSVIGALIWFWLKRPDCKCWDDIQIEKDIDCPQKKIWNEEGQGKSWGYGGTDD